MEFQNILRLLDEIETIVEQSIGLLGKKFVEEQKFLIVAEQVGPLLSLNSSNAEIINHWQQIEQIMDKGYECLMGRRMISEEEFFASMQKLRYSLSIAMKQAGDPSREMAFSDASPMINRQIGFEELLRDGERVFDEVVKGESFFVVREGHIVARLTPFQ